MKTKKAIKILKEMNKWRRAEPPYEEMGSMPYNPGKYGKAIDQAIKVMEDWRTFVAHFKGE